MIVTCRYCKEVLNLGEDSDTARNSGDDPHQRMRRHLVDKHFIDMLSHARRVGWLIDALAFEAPNDPNWQKHLQDLLKWAQTPEAIGAAQ